jgi:hypothetical protein
MIAAACVQSCQNPVSLVVVPADGATEAPLATALTMTFNRDITPGEFINREATRGSAAGAP